MSATVITEWISLSAIFPAVVVIAIVTIATAVVVMASVIAIATVVTVVSVVSVTAIAVACWNDHTASEHGGEERKHENAFHIGFSFEN